MNVSTPIVDISPHLEATEQAREACKRVADALAEYGQVIFRDDRVNFLAGHGFIEDMQKFFAKPTSIKELCRMPQCSHQTGWTPADAELPGAANGEKDAIIAALAPEHRPTPVTGPDKKERFMTPIGPRLDAEKYGYHEFNANPFVVPHGQPELLGLALTWGGDLLAGGMSILEMAAIGWGEAPDFFTKRMRFGPHFLAPTGSDLIAHGKPGTVLAGFHNDMSLGTIMSLSTHPGLYAWTRSGIRYPVRVPRGHLFFQAGRQLQWLTGGKANRVFHEVIAVEENVSLIEAAIAKGEPCIRVASPLFMHCNTNESVGPDGSFQTPEALKEFPPYILGVRTRGALRSRGLGPMD
jgi:isopenicillin N synthase-like dioxygenase